MSGPGGLTPVGAIVAPPEPLEAALRARWGACALVLDHEAQALVMTIDARRRTLHESRTVLALALDDDWTIAAALEAGALTNGDVLYRGDLSELAAHLGVAYVWPKQSRGPSSRAWRRVERGGAR